MFEDFFNKSFYGNTAGDWLIAFLIILGFVVISKVFYWILSNIVKKITNRTKTRLDDLIIDMIEEPVAFAIIIGGVWYALYTLNFSERIDIWIGRVYYLLIIFNIAWLITRLFDSIIQEYLTPLVSKSYGDLDDQLLPIVRKGLKVSVWVIAIIVGINNAGYDVGALIAGLGIGGLAFALAAQDSISNLFGGFTIFAVKPFVLNDRVKIAGYDGSIEEIGVRSTRLRTLEGRLVTIPNKTFTSDAIENISSEPSRKVVMNLGLTYDTTHEQILKALDILKEIAANNENLEENVLTSFNSFGDFALNILFIYYIKKEKDIQQTLTAINVEILKQFNDNNLEFAFPTQTLYTKKF